MTMNQLWLRQKNSLGWKMVCYYHDLDVMIKKIKRFDENSLKAHVSVLTMNSVQMLLFTGWNTCCNLMPWLLVNQ